jgi:hypothetical protein
MPEYMILIHEPLSTGATLAPTETRSLLDQQAAYAQKLRALSAYVDGERLRPSNEGRRVRGGAAEPQVIAGPLDEPSLEAYHVVRAVDLDAALDLAKQFPVPSGTSIEVRPVMSGHLEPEKTSEQGRLFAFAVLGSAPNEGAWTEIMDRIDERTHDHFPEQQFRGGARLEAPSRGRQIRTSGGRRAIFDGPFLESKEVIGGLFFMCMASLEEAVAWAKESAFVEYGTLEIRELWRS